MMMTQLMTVVDGRCCEKKLKSGTDVSMYW